LFLGCVPAASSPRPGAQGTVAVAVQSRLAWPYSLERWRVALDGAIVSDTPVAAIEGVHTVQVRAEVSLKCSVLSNRHARAIIVANHTFTTESQPAVVGAELYMASDVTAHPEDRLRVRFTLRGATAGGSVYWPPPKECRELLPIPRAICAVSALVEIARKNRDIILLNCAHDKLKQLQSTYDEATARRLEQEAYQCIGEDLCYFESTQVTVEDTCGADLSFSEPRVEEPLRVPPQAAPAAPP
jgi:hypothetical protein